MSVRWREVAFLHQLEEVEALVRAQLVAAGAQDPALCQLRVQLRLEGGVVHSHAFYVPTNHSTDVMETVRRVIELEGPLGSGLALEAAVDAA